MQFLAAFVWAAETSDTVLIVTSIFTFLGTVFGGIMAYFMAKLKGGQDKVAGKAEVIAGKVEDHAITQGKQLVAIATGIGEVKTGVDQVHLATNSLAHKLMEKTEAEALARGKFEEKARALAEEEKKGGGVSDA